MYRPDGLVGTSSGIRAAPKHAGNARVGSDHNRRALRGCPSRSVTTIPYMPVATIKAEGHAPFVDPVSHRHLWPVKRFVIFQKIFKNH